MLMDCPGKGLPCMYIAYHQLETLTSSVTTIFASIVDTCCFVNRGVQGASVCNTGVQGWAEQAAGHVEQVATFRAGGLPAGVRTIAHCGFTGTVAYSLTGSFLHVFLCTYVPVCLSRYVLLHAMERNMRYPVTPVSICPMFVRCAMPGEH